MSFLFEFYNMKMVEIIENDKMKNEIRFACC